MSFDNWLFVKPKHAFSAFIALTCNFSIKDSFKLQVLASLRKNKHAPGSFKLTFTSRMKFSSQRFLKKNCLKL